MPSNSFTNATYTSSVSGSLPTFDEVDRMHQQMRQAMEELRRLNGGWTTLSINADSRQPIKKQTVEEKIKSLWERSNYYTNIEAKKYKSKVIKKQVKAPSYVQFVQDSWRFHMSSM